MAQRLFGLETEYSFSALGPNGSRVEQDLALQSLMNEAKRLLPHLPDRESGIFLQNGSRLYLDSGGHPELAICEVVDPWDACRYVSAGERILAEVAKETGARNEAIKDIVLTRCNVSYAPSSNSTWGCHESYGHRADPASLPDALIPHLVSRLIYTGAGGFDSRSSGIGFMLSPRVTHLQHVVSDASTANRGIFHTKDETLGSNGFHRLHVICGDSVCSQTALWLKVAINCSRCRCG